MKSINLYLSSLLIALLALAGCSQEKYVFEDLGDPVKSFYTNTEGKLLINQRIAFTNESVNGDSYLWDFGDGTTSTEKNPTKVYTEGGSYTVKLKVIGASGTGNYSKKLVIIDPDAVVLSDKFLYYIEDDVLIKKISVNPGSTAETILDISDKSGLGLACDTVNSKIYFTETDSDNGKVWMMNMDGTGLIAIASGFSDPNSIVVDHAAKKLYWVNMDGTVSKSNLDGTGLVRELVKIKDGDLRGLAVNSKTGELYFMDYEGEVIYKCKSDGSDIVSISDEDVFGFAMYVDEVNDKLYFHHRRKGGIVRSNLDGSGAELYITVGTTSSDRVYGIAIDNELDKIYWSLYKTDEIVRMNFDGTKRESIAGTVVTPRAIFLK